MTRSRVAHRVALVLLLAVAGLAAAARPTSAAEDATSAKDLEAKATFHCIGLKWDLAGDANRNATCTVRYRRKGAAAWREGLALFRVAFRSGDMEMNTGETRRGTVNALAGSLLHLAAGTTYEVALALADPDGGSTAKTLEATTHALPQDPEQPRTVKVPVGQLQKAVAAAEPGDILLLEPGDHGNGFPIAKSGTAERPIIIRGPADGEAVVRGGIGVSGSWLWFDRLTLDCTNRPAPGAKADTSSFFRTGAQGKNGLNGDAKSSEIFVTRCRFLNHHYGCNVYGHRWFITDCTFSGEHEWNDDFLTLGKVKGHMSGEGIDFHHHRGGCCVAAFNDITGTADGISYGDNNIDVYHNHVYETCDDLIEMDYGYHNYRVWGNLAHSSLAGLSFQPFNGGPWYVFRNQVTGAGLNILKLKEGYGPVVFVGNTLVQAAPYKRFSVLLDGIFANNAWVSLPNASIGSNRQGDDFRLTRMRFMDHNAYGVGDKPVWVLEKNYSLADLRAIGLDKSSVVAKGDDVLTNLPENPRKGTGKCLLPKEGSALVDGGAVLPGLTAAWAGKAPDIGAHERALGPQWVGPRTYAPSGLAYGAPAAWAAADKVGDFADLGAPAKASNVALLLARQKPRAFLLVTFEPLPGDKAWSRFDGLLEGAPPEGVVRYTDSLAARLDRRKVGDRPVAALVAAQWNRRGVWHVLGGCEEKDLGALRGELFLFVSSLLETISGPDASRMQSF
ncbi:MAG TPA: hypothetical protein VNE39_16805 [Planctomycetota bacterium]|nr:hypothetical protein [Planctomycetota bacterium]